MVLFPSGVGAAHIDLGLLVRDSDHFGIAEVTELRVSDSNTQIGKVHFMMQKQK